MESEAKYALVGAAVLVLVGLLVAAILWLRTVGEGANDMHFKIYFERQSLEGLAVRSDVLMRGIRVGAVTGFRFSERRREAVEVFISVAPNTPVRTNTQAVVDRHLVTGIASVRLLNPNENAPLLTLTPAGEPYPVIAEGESPFAQVSQTVNELALRASETLQRINTVLSDENQQEIRRALNSLGDIAGQTEATLLSVRDTAEEVRRLSRSLGTDAGKLAARYDELGAEATRSAREVSAAVRKLSGDTSRLAQSAEALLASSDAEVRATAQALREAADALAVAARNFDDPRGLLFGPPAGAFGPGEGGQ
jgi:phospholipid/cholesterol/gamma-HCH transport system substrate-binding protein